jgi:Flp pilus assembly protein TadG
MKIRRRARNRSGAVLVEAALVLPLLLTFILGVMEYGRYLMMLQLFTVAARQGAEYASKHTNPIVISGTTYGNATSDVLNVVNSYLAGQQLVGQNTSVYMSDNQGNNLGTWTSARSGNYVCVQITGTYQFSVPSLLYLPSTMAMNFKEVVPSEGN